MTWREKGECPNAHGPLVIFKKPPPILHLLSEDMLDVANLMGEEDTPEHMFGYLLAVCQECGFVLSSAPSYEYNYDLGKWRPVPIESVVQTSGDSTT